MGEDDATTRRSERAIDGRDAAAIEDDARARVPFYTGEEWDPDAGGPGTALLEGFGELAAGVVERLDQVPSKHRTAFADALGFDRRPPQSAELPLTVQVSDGAGGNVYLPSGTRAIAPASETTPELTFEFEDGFEATTAGLDRLVSVAPRLDHVATHAEALAGTGEATLFGGANDQRHLLSLGHGELLTLDGGATVQVRLSSTVDAATLAALEWEYYAEPPDDAPDDAEAGWRRRTPTDVEPVARGDRVSVDEVARILDDHGFELTTDDQSAVEQWLVSTVLARERADPTPPFVDRARRPDVVDLYESLDRYVDRVYGAYPPDVSAELDGATLTFSIDWPFAETEQFGVESNWIRARLPADAPPPLAARFRALAVENVQLAAGRLRNGGGNGETEGTGSGGGLVADGSGGDGSEPGAFPPDDLLANDVPLEVPTPENGETVLPFGTLPRVQDAFYVGSREAFTKTGQRVTLSFSRDDAVESLDDGPPRISWEYWNGSAWEYLDVEGDGDDAVAFLTDSGAVTFTVPDDLAATGVSGHQGHWIRVRLVGGGYGEIRTDTCHDEGGHERDGIWQRLDEISEPELAVVSLAYEADGGDGASTPGGGGDSSPGDGDDPPTSGDGPVPPGLITATPEQCYADNDLSATAVDPETQFQPFRPLADDEQTLYLGFDGPLDGGPLQAFVDLADVEYPPGFAPRVRWEVSTDAGWRQVSVRDGTEGLTERGVVRFSPPSETTALSRFGATRHWLRARVTGPGGFVGAPYRRRRGRAGEETGSRCGDHLPTTPPGSEAAMALPATGLVAHNAGLAANVRTVSDDVLGSSDGTPDQQFEAASPPVDDPTVWVEELATLSAGEREALTDDPAVTVDPVGDEADLDAFWVQWDEVENFLASGDSARHYALDPVAGTVTFGDGTRGAIPPRGRDNVRISYETGGGAAGNLPAGAIGELEGSLAFVDGVVNPLPGDGGADAEASTAVLDRAAEQLRDRNRAVAPVDFERIARASARKLARARCLPGLGPRGDYQPGWVTVLVVPRSNARKPVPSASLRTQVTEGLRAHAPASLLGDRGDERLVVRGPSYVEVSVEATVVAGAVDSFAELETATADALGAFLHPLSGGDDGDGWPFGTLPCASDCYGVLEGVPGVDHVEDVALHLAAPGATRTVVPGQGEPSVEHDVLVHSGVHDLDVVGRT